MADGLIFFMYIVAGSMGLVGILQILLLFRYGNTGNRALFTPMRRFMLCTVALDFLYLGYDYYRLKHGSYDSTMILRVMDIELCVLQPYFWAMYVRARCRRSTLGLARCERSAFFLTLVCGLLGLIDYGLMMEGYYESASPALAKIDIVIEIFINLALAWIVVSHLVLALREIVSPEKRGLITLVSAGCIVNLFFQAVLSVSILTGHSITVMERELDMTPLCMLAVNIGAVMLLYSEDFSTLFSKEGNAAAGQVPLPAAGEIIAAEHRQEGDPVFRTETVPPEGHLPDGERSPAEIIMPSAQKVIVPGSEGLMSKSPASEAPSSEGFASEGPATAVPATAVPTSAVPSSASPAPEAPVPGIPAPASGPGTSSAWDPETLKQYRLDHIAEAHQLTVREREVLELCYDGMTNPEIAAALYISFNTVKRHLHNIFEKLDVSTRIELVHMVSSVHPQGHGH